MDNIDFFRNAGIVAGTLVSAGSIVWACLKAGAFFGRSESAMESIAERLESLSSTLEHFATNTDARIQGHETRLTRVETKLDLGVR